MQRMRRNIFNLDRRKGVPKVASRRKYVKKLAYAGEHQTHSGTKMAKPTRYECKRCYHKWTPRGKGRPTACPSCKSGYWDKPPLPIWMEAKD